MTAKDETVCANAGFSRKRRFANRVRSIVKNPYHIMVAVSVILMVYLILIPLGQMIVQTLTLAQADVGRVEGGREGGNVYPLLLEARADQQHIPENAVDAS